MKTFSYIIALVSILITTALSEDLSLTVVEHPGLRVPGSKDATKPKRIAYISAKDKSKRNDLIKLWAYASEAIPKDRRTLFGPDSGYIELILKKGKEKMVIRSWHPLFDNNPKVVVTSRGLEALNGRDRATVMKNDKAWYIKARKCFDTILAYAKK